MIAYLSHIIAFSIYIIGVIVFLLLFELTKRGGLKDKKGKAPTVSQAEICSPPEMSKMQDVKPVVPKTTYGCQTPNTRFAVKDSIAAVSCSVQGYGHLGSGKECQDCSGVWVEKNFQMCAVSDGHGGNRYFRSRVGAEKALDITYETVKEFLWRDETRTVLEGVPFLKFGKRADCDIARPEDKKLYGLFEQLFRAIISRWHDAIEKDAKCTTITEWETRNVNPKYLQQLKDMRNVEKIYGCTLIAYVQTDSFWFAFQIGDGKFIAFDVNGQHICQPIPWDEQCFLNMTTSLCGSHSSEEFRFCCQGGSQFPRAVFIGSDGIDDTFSLDRDIADFYVKIAQFTIANGAETMARELEASLPVLSKKGSQDDMSVACLIDTQRTSAFMPILVHDQLRNIETAAMEKENTIAKLQRKHDSLSQKNSLTRSEQIELRYAAKELGTENRNLASLQARMSQLQDKIKGME